MVSVPSFLYLPKPFLLVIIASLPFFPPSPPKTLLPLNHDSLHWQHRISIPSSIIRTRFLLEISVDLICSQTTSKPSATPVALYNSPPRREPELFPSDLQASSLVMSNAQISRAVVGSLGALLVDHQHHYNRFWRPFPLCLQILLPVLVVPPLPILVYLHLHCISPVQGPVIPQVSVAVSSYLNH